MRYSHIEKTFKIHEGVNFEGVNTYFIKYIKYFEVNDEIRYASSLNQRLEKSPLYYSVAFAASIASRVSSWLFTQ